jgi:hypothetical protein
VAIIGIHSGHDTPSWASPPYLLAWDSHDALPRREVRRAARRPLPRSGPGRETFDFSAAMAALCADVCRHVSEFRHIDAGRVLVGVLQARTQRRAGLQARVTPLRFPGGNLVRATRGRAYQVQRYVVAGREMLYLMSFCLPRFLALSFDEKFVTIFHELYHIGPRFDGDLRRHRGRYCLHTGSKAGYDARMAELADSYLARGASSRLHGFLRFTFDELRARHGRVVGVAVPRPKILPLPFGLAEACRVT